MRVVTMRVENHTSLISSESMSFPLLSCEQVREKQKREIRGGGHEEEQEGMEEEKEFSEDEVLESPVEKNATEKTEDKKADELMKRKASDESVGCGSCDEENENQRSREISHDEFSGHVYTISHGA